MTYKFFQILMRLVLKVYFRKIYLIDVANISPHQPALLACNHPNSFMDAILLAVLIKQPLHFLARSDVFNTPLKEWFLSKINLIPIYRLEEGSENLHKNQDTFEVCYKILKQNGKILIFSEGICVQEKKLRPLRKGTARLAFGAELKFSFNLNLQIIPITLNYTYPAVFRSEVLIGVGQPIEVSKHKAAYENGPAKAILAFNKDLLGNLKENLIEIDNPEDEAVLEKYLIRNRLKSPEFTNARWLSRDKSLLVSEQQICRKYYELNKGPAGNKSSFLNLGDSSINKELNELNYSSHFLNAPLKFFLIILFPVYVLGWLLNFLPFALARWLTRRKVKKVEFYASVLLVLGMVFYLIYLVVLTSLLIYLFGLAGILSILVIVLLGWVALKWYDQFKLFRLKTKVNLAF